MKYIESFRFPSDDDEAQYILEMPPELDMQCYSDNVYPFKVFTYRGMPKIEFAPVTIFYGGNGSGKSTMLNVIAQKLGLDRASPFYSGVFMDAYLKRCRYELTGGKRLPSDSRIITSDDVFDFLIDIRSINEGIADRRQEIFDEYYSYTDPTKPTFQMRSLDDYDELKARNDARRSTRSAFTARRMPKKELSSKSNGESAYLYFTQHINENALYLLDEPENSLSAKLQAQLRQFIRDSVRFYGCQFIISTHSPFLLSIRGAKIYDLDAEPISESAWTELENVRIYHDFFEEHRDEFFSQTDKDGD